MSYTPTEWKSGDTITSTKLNKMEQGIAAGGSGGGVLVASLDTSTGLLDKTWQEINDADFAVVVAEAGRTKGILPIVSVTAGTDKISYEVVVASITAQGVTTITGSANAASDYPEFSLGG